MTGQIRVLVVDDHPIVRGGIAALVDDEPDFELVGEAGDGETALRIIAATRPDVVLMDLRMPGIGGAEATARISDENSDAERDYPRVLVLTTYESDDEILAAIEAGASGYLLKDAPADDIREAIRRVAAGEVALAPKIAAKLVAQTRAARAQASGGNAGNGRTEGNGGNLDGRASRSPEAGSVNGTTHPNGTAHPDGPGSHQRDGLDPRGSRPALSDREREILALVAEGCSNGEAARRLFIGDATVKSHLANAYEKLGVRDRTSAVLRAIELGLIRR